MHWLNYSYPTPIPYLSHGVGITSKLSEQKTALLERQGTLLWHSALLPVTLIEHLETPLHSPSVQSWGWGWPLAVQRAYIPCICTQPFTSEAASRPHILVKFSWVWKSWEWKGQDIIQRQCLRSQSGHPPLRRSVSFLVCRLWVTLDKS